LIESLSTFNNSLTTILCKQEDAIIPLISEMGESCSRAPSLSLDYAIGSNFVELGEILTSSDGAFQENLNGFWVN
jgi:hypothetical protein